MAPLLNAESISKAYGSKTLFQGISLHLFQGEKVALIGPNGSGKSTLLKILCGIESPDEGRVSRQRHLKIGYVPQMTTYSENTPEDVLLTTLSIENHLDEHERRTRARIALGKADFKNPGIPIETLSGGWKKRLDIANALVLNPDILLLDEPTNHLDIEGILWLENFLQRSSLS
jgi:ATP-binding cassette subfamily F protein uup